MSVIIVGGGIHGVATAFFLAKKGIRCIIIEKDFIAAGASGKAGGFLGREWGDQVTQELHRKSFDLHVELAAELDIKSFRLLTTLSVDTSATHGAPQAPWLDRRAASTVIEGPNAQVTPLELTTRLLSKATELVGTELLIGAVVGVLFDVEDSSTVRGLHVRHTNGDIQTIATDTVVVCLGPWSGVFCEDHFGMTLPMDGVKSTSLVFQSVPAIQTAAEPCACFCAEDEDTGCHLELYPRETGDLYVCGCGGNDYVRGDRLREGGDSDSASKVGPDPARVQAAVTSLKKMTSIGDLTPDLQQACLRPCTPDALPVMGAVPGIQGAYVSCGHNCWGILWAPICGLAMAELVADGRSTCVDLAAFDPNRFAPSQSAKKARGRKHVEVDVGEQW